MKLELHNVNIFYHRQVPNKSFFLQLTKIKKAMRTEAETASMTKLPTVEVMTMKKVELENEPQRRQPRQANTPDIPSQTPNQPRKARFKERL